MTILKGVAFVFSLSLIGSAFILGLVVRQNWPQMTTVNKLAGGILMALFLVGGILLITTVSR